ncbi:TonB-dependent receptor (plasmid) [Alteromonas sp. I4]|nr:TonB-dependent receptor [Alteromonas sp. I4]
MKTNLKNTLRFKKTALAIGVSFAAFNTSSFAQDATEKEAEDVEVIEVTGSLIRGIAPSGTQVLGVSEDDIKASGALSSNELLGSVPQAGNLFNMRTTVTPSSGSQIQIVRPNLRALPGGPLATGAATLILVDGHRVPGVGVGQVATDPDMIPPGVLERVEIITDGGSSIYGADAIGGVINFITKRDFEGVQVDIGYGSASNYTSYDTNITAGTFWDSGSVYLSYNYADQDEILNSQRDYARRLDWSTGLQTYNTCASPTVSITQEVFVGPPLWFETSSTTYAAPTFEENTLNYCDNSQGQSFSPAVDRENVFTGLFQELGDNTELTVKAFYSRRDSASSTGPLTGSARMESQNPYYIDLDGMGSAQSVQLNFAPYQQPTHEKVAFDSWGVTSEVRSTFDNDWQVRGMVNYGKSESMYNTPDINPALLTSYGQNSTLDSAVNFYDITSTQNTALLDDILDYARVGEADNEILNLRLIADGAIFSLPAGEVKMAIGAEYTEETYTRREGLIIPSQGQDLIEQKYKRDVSAVFTEVQIPIVSANNAVAGIESLAVSLSTRYDKYSDFGSTTNPKIGITYNPVDWLAIRASWGESFNAPTAVDQLSSSFNSAGIFPSIVVPNPDDMPGPGTSTISIQGAAKDLKPQTATTKSIGFDMAPPALEDFNFSLSYYEIDFKNLLSKPPVFDAAEFYANYPDFYVLHPTKEQIAAAGEYAFGGNEVVAPYLLDGAPEIYNIIYFITANLGNTNIAGLDFSVRQAFYSDAADIVLGLNGNYRLKAETQATTGAPWQDDLAFNESIYTMKASVDVNFDQVAAHVNYSYRSGYDVTGLFDQTQVAGFGTVNMFINYMFDGDDWKEDLSVSLNIDNVFDREPPVFRSNGGDGYTNGFTLGRQLKLGVSKRF